MALYNLAQLSNLRPVTAGRILGAANAAGSSQSQPQMGNVGLAGQNGLPPIPQPQEEQYPPIDLGDVYNPESSLFGLKQEMSKYNQMAQRGWGQEGGALSPLLTMMGGAGEDRVRKQIEKEMSVAEQSLKFYKKKLFGEAEKFFDKLAEAEKTADPMDDMKVIMQLRKMAWKAKSDIGQDFGLEQILENHIKESRLQKAMEMQAQYNKEKMARDTQMSAKVSALKMILAPENENLFDEGQRKQARDELLRITISQASNGMTTPPQQISDPYAQTISELSGL